jgi:hypothetical protein
MHITAGAGAAAAAFFFMAASLEPAEPITKAAAVAAINTAYPIFFSFIVSSEN